MYLSVSGAKFICWGAIAALFFKESSEQNIGKQFLLSSLSPGNINFRMQENTEATLRLSQNKSATCSWFLWIKYVLLLLNYYSFLFSIS